MGALIPLIGALLSGSGAAAEAALGTITAFQWIEIGLQVAGAAPEIRKALAALHPAFTTLVTAIEQNLANGDIAAAESGAAAVTLSLGPHYHGGPKSP